MRYKRTKRTFDDWLRVFTDYLQKYNKYGLGIYLDTAKTRVLIRDLSPESFDKSRDLIRLRPTNLTHHTDSLKSCHASGEVPFLHIVEKRQRDRH